MKIKDLIIKTCDSVTNLIIFNLFIGDSISRNNLRDQLMADETAGRLRIQGGLS